MDNMAVVTVFDCVDDLPEHTPCVHLRHAAVQRDVICQQMSQKGLIQKLKSKFKNIQENI